MNPDQFAEILRTMLARGFEPPLVCTTVGANGSVLVIRMDWAEGGSLGADIVTQDTIDDAFALPTNVMFVDSNGEAARVVLERERIVYS
jgi:hypothetical protein